MRSGSCLSSGGFGQGSAVLFGTEADQFRAVDVFEDLHPFFHLCRVGDGSGAFEHCGPEVFGEEGEGCFTAAGGDDGEGDFVEQFDEGFLEFFCCSAGDSDVCDPVGDLGVEGFFAGAEFSVEGDVGTGGEVFGPVGKSVPVQFSV